MADRVGQQLGNYRLVRVLGQGMFATVYLGEHQYLERLAAIKVLHVRMEAGTHESFRCEARTIAQLHHPRIISVYDFGIEEDTPYLVMEYTPNGTLRERFPKGTCLPFEQIITFVKQIASALDYAHEQHVIHRDVKPENILLDANDGVVLSDFGIAVVQRTQDPLSMQNPAGTPIYMAPEQIQHTPCAASDQYALGVMVYEWLCGEAPFHGSLFEVWSQHLHKPPPSLCARIKELPPAVEDAVFRALAKERGQRFERVADFATALSEALFATQPLLLRESFEHRARGQATLPLTRSANSLVPLSSEQGHSDNTKQSVLGIGRERELVSSACSLSTIHSQTVPKQTGRSLSQTNRQRLLRRVRSFWITGVLEQSLHGAGLLALGLQEQPDAVANPWHLVLQHPGTAPRPVPPGTCIAQVYDQADGELLILGPPGAGKTTLLLELARDLLSRAECDEYCSIPVIFNLSSWVMQRQPLVDWLIEELVSKYRVPRKLSHTLVNADQILPLLDGLDEVAPKERITCIETINLYRQEHGLLPLVVCSRSADYLAQSTLLQLRTAVVVQPLTLQQIEAYLISAGEQLAGLRQSLQVDADLQALASTPLMLNVLMQAYQGTPVGEIATLDTLPAKQQQIFASYVRRMLTCRSITSHYTAEQTIHWLAYLARQMNQHSQTIFYIERMQSDWLPEDRSRQFYHGITGRLFPGLLPGLLFGFYTWLNSGSWVDGFLVGLVSWLLFGLMSGVGKERVTVEGVFWSWTRVWRNLGKGLLVGLGSGLLAGLLSGLRSGLVMGLDIGLVEGLTGGVFSGLFFELVEGTETEREPMEVVLWSWRAARRSLGKALLVGLLVVLIFGLSFGLFSGLVYESLYGFAKGLIFGLISGIADGLNFTLLVVLFFGLFSGLSSGVLDEHERATPNQGIWDSARNSMRVGLVGGLIVGSLFGLFAWFLYEPSFAVLASGLSYGLIVGMAFGLRGGGLACVKHVVLRLLLWRTWSIPWNYPRFLDYAAERTLLRKVRGGYIFLHRLLLDYFAVLEAPLVPHEPAEDREEIVSPVEVPLALTGPIAPDRLSELFPCGHELRSGARFCSVCGAPVPS